MVSNNFGENIPHIRVLTAKTFKEESNQWQKLNYSKSAFKNLFQYTIYFSTPNLTSFKNVILMEI